MKSLLQASRIAVAAKQDVAIITSIVTCFVYAWGWTHRFLLLHFGANRVFFLKPSFFFFILQATEC
jgi:hypothetical protein